MTKYEIASYLADLMTVDAYFDDIGVNHKWLNDEMAAIAKELEKSTMEKEYEVRPSRYIPQEGTNPPKSEPRRSEPVGNGNGDKTQHGKGFRRPGP